MNNFYADLVLRALLDLVKHDIAQDNRERLPHCIELQAAMEVLHELLVLEELTND